MINLLEKILLEVQRLIQGNETLALFLSLTITVAGILYLFLVTNYVDPYLVSKKKVSEVKNPLVSFLVSVKDDEEAIIDCINSMTSQTYQNYEIFVVDDASTDSTPEVLDTNFGKIPNINIIYLNKNIGK